MKPKLPILIFLFSGLCVMPMCAWAHHGSSAYDFTKLVTTRATVSELVWRNPHCMLKFDARDEKGAVTSWTVEMFNPLWMSRAGWTRETLKPGDEIEIIFHPAKNGTGNGYIRLPESKILLHNQSLNMDENGAGATASPAAQ
jgi:Family of unknown function (DUF6152)